MRSGFATIRSGRAGRRALLAVPVSMAALLIAAFAFGCRCAPRPGPAEEEAVAWPLTGLEAPDSQAVLARIVSVKVENSQAARPQVNLAEADLVYETLAEGGITRFNALYHSSAPSEVGPVRSARLSDIYVVPQYDALFAYSGASDFTEERLAQADIDDMGYSDHPGPYARSERRPSPHNLFVDLPDLRQAAEEAGFESDEEPPSLAFGDAPASATTSGSEIGVPFNQRNRVVWRWDQETGGYLRELNGQPHGDEGSERPYEASNVVVLFAETEETGETDVTGAPVLDIVLEGSGSAIVFRDGQGYEGRWIAEGSPPRFETADGEQILLAPGKTWFEVVGTDFELTAQ